MNKSIKRTNVSFNANQRSNNQSRVDSSNEKAIEKLNYS
jgi:hypothetical protein